MKPTKVKAKRTKSHERFSIAQVRSGRELNHVLGMTGC
jgi:hypothetical protein